MSKACPRTHAYAGLRGKLTRVKRLTVCTHAPAQSMFLLEYCLQALLRDLDARAMLLAASGAGTGCLEAGLLLSRGCTGRTSSVGNKLECAKTMRRFLGQKKVKSYIVGIAAAACLASSGTKCLPRDAIKRLQGSRAPVSVKLLTQERVSKKLVFADCSTCSQSSSLTKPSGEALRKFLYCLRSHDLKAKNPCVSSGWTRQVISAGTNTSHRPNIFALSMTDLWM